MISDIRLLAVAACFLLVLPTVTLASCLTDSEKTELEKIAANTNASASTFVSIFEHICADIEARYTKTEADTRYDSLYTNFTNELSQTESDLNESISQSIADLEDSLNISQSLAAVAAIVSTMADIEDLKNDYQRIEDIMDERFNNFKRDYVRKDELANFTSSPTGVTYRAPFNWWIVIIIIIAGLIGGAIYFRGKKTAEEVFPKMPIRKHHVTELATSPKLKERAQKRKKEVNLFAEKQKGDSKPERRRARKGKGKGKKELALDF